MVQMLLMVPPQAEATDSALYLPHFSPTVWLWGYEGGLDYAVEA